MYEEQRHDAEADLPTAEEQRVGSDAEERAAKRHEELADDRHFREQRNDACAQRAPSGLCSARRLRCRLPHSTRHDGVAGVGGAPVGLRRTKIFWRRWIDL